MGRILSTVDRRKFLRATGSAAALSLSGRLGLARTLPEVGALHRLVEETPHERVAAELATLIRDGLDHRRTLTALAVATSRRVQPFPHVGFKYHTVLALQSVHLTALNLPDEERWLPVFWALDYFKRAQEQERRQSGWTMGPQPDPVAGTVEAALENHREMAPTAWRDRILSASMAYFIGSATAPSPVSQKALQLLG